MTTDPAGKRHRFSRQPTAESSEAMSNEDRSPAAPDVTTNPGDPVDKEYDFDDYIKSMQEMRQTMEGLATTLQKMQLEARSWLCWLPTRGPYSGDILLTVAKWNRSVDHMFLGKTSISIEAAEKLLDEFADIKEAVEQWEEIEDDPLFARFHAD